MTPLLTLFSAPKPFSDPHIATIQRNAIQSWMQIGKEIEILLIGKESGIEAIANEFQLIHLRDVKCNEKGTPLVSSIFNLARQTSQAHLLSYVNADILLFPDYLSIANMARQQLEYFLVIGQRWDLDITKPLDFSAGWEKRLKNEIADHGQLHFPAGSDFFIFPRETFNEIPDFAIGRAGWDNWMIYHAKQQGWQIVDATPSLLVIHQSHDYSHLTNGLPHYDQEESQYNLQLAGGVNRMYTILDSDLQIIHNKVKRPRMNLLRFSRTIENRLMSGEQQRSGNRWALARAIRRWRRKKIGSLS